MSTGSPASLKLNAMKAFNGVGIVIAVLLGIVLVIPGGKNVDAGFTETQHLFYYVIPLPALLILAYKRVLIDPSERRIRITKGIWPLVVTQEIPFDDSVEIQIDAMHGRWISYSARLSLPSQKKPISILADGDEDQLRAIIDFARNAGFHLETQKGMQEHAPDRIRKIMPELSQVLDH